MMLNRKAPCHCGSGKLYKSCHYAADRAAEAGTQVTSQLDSQRQEYAERWRTGNAEPYATAGHYAWMAKALEGYRKVLEVGPGTGSSTLALASSGHLIVAVDENPACLAATKECLARGGIESLLELRGTARGEAGIYRIEYRRPAVTPFVKPVTLVEGDIVGDASLSDWLGEVGPFDAVACWLVGTHEARGANTVIAPFGFENAGEYRLKVENLVYELADRVLRPGGVLQVVGRGEYPATDVIREDVLQGHRAQASVTKLVVESLECREYTDHPAAGGVEMTVTIPLSGRRPKMDRTAFYSVVSRKS